jgi:hypothetical protein
MTESRDELWIPMYVHRMLRSEEVALERYLMPETLISTFPFQLHEDPSDTNQLTLRRTQRMSHRGKTQSEDAKQIAGEPR